ncbi:unnamed protein product [Gongylonema pulchrum]|uniref:Calpastatin n=1 Tax=Gongylonema pulchrum TaxID=637853 RepID=A0A183EBB9_9BILA|nr:unnamed protein product [Gongylonema pulchrum]
MYCYQFSQRIADDPGDDRNQVEKEKYGLRGRVAHTPIVTSQRSNMTSFIMSLQKSTKSQKSSSSSVPSTLSTTSKTASSQKQGKDDSASKSTEKEGAAKDPVKPPSVGKEKGIRDSTDDPHAPQLPLGVQDSLMSVSKDLVPLSAERSWPFL